MGSARSQTKKLMPSGLFFNDVVKTSDIDFQTDTAQPLEPELIDLVGLSGTIKELEKDLVIPVCWMRSGWSNNLWQR